MPDSEAGGANGAVDYSVTCSECGTSAWYTCNLYSEAKAKAQEDGWGFHGMKTLYADIGHGQRRQRAELGTVYCPVHQEIFEADQLREAQERAKAAAQAEERRVRERPGRFRMLAEHLREAAALADELGVCPLGVDLEGIAHYAEGKATIEEARR